MASRKRGARPLSLFVQYADPRLKELVPRLSVRRWARSALLAPAELTIRFVGAEEARALNFEYRQRDYATNVLTFAYNDIDGGPSAAPVHADIVLCTDVLEREAAEQGISVTDHAAHLIVHGVLHAPGHDHVEEGGA
ncbi:rRNA maturation RNase YbeY, partial [Lacisediminimonas sp.]|uniref:rRNA maturation RNase YbeY n=1 Tax=Lacisediminimonas sp. TaxID=3060582 RepID=UPI00271E9B2A